MYSRFIALIALFFFAETNQVSATPSSVITEKRKHEKKSFLERTQLVFRKNGYLFHQLFYINEHTNELEQFAITHGTNNIIVSVDTARDIALVKTSASYRKEVILIIPANTMAENRRYELTLKNGGALLKDSFNNSIIGLKTNCL